MRGPNARYTAAFGLQILDSRRDLCDGGRREIFVRETFIKKTRGEEKSVILTELVVYPHLSLSAQGTRWFSHGSIHMQSVENTVEWPYPLLPTTIRVGHVVRFAVRIYMIMTVSLGVLYE